MGDFSSTDKFSAYIRIVPRIKPTIGERITKWSNKLVRTTLVQCTLIAIRYSGYLNSFYQHIKKRRDSGAAMIETKKKLLTIIYHTLKDCWVFDDFTQFKIKQNQLYNGQLS